MSSRPLAAVVVIDLSRYLPGPLAARMLANLGARVIKIEQPGSGDPVRRSDGLAALLLAGVESVVLDLTRDADRRVLAALLTRADVLLESFRPGKLAEFGLPPDELERVYPRLVACSISGWGSSGPWADRAGHDLTYQAAAGALSAGGEMPNLPAADLLGAFAAVAAINAALVERAESGRGAHIDASLFDAARIGAEIQAAHPPLAGGVPCYRIYSAADGRPFAFGALEPPFWRRFCRAAERPDLEPLQYDAEPASHAALEELFAERTAAEWAALCHAHDLPGEAVGTVEEGAASPQAAARELAVRDRRLPFPALIDGERPAAAGTIPPLGDDTRAILDELGLDPAGRG